MGERYPGYRVLDQQEHWDDTTRRVVLDRVHNVPNSKNFNEHERRTVEALCERVIPQAHKPVERRVPLVAWIDLHSTSKVVGGFRFADMPPNDEAWPLGLRGLDESARAKYARDFADLEPQEQGEVIRLVMEGNPPGQTWERVPPIRWIKGVAIRQIAAVYYAHPFAWDEIGFGGPAYPRGYVALNHGMPEPWEVHEAPAR